MRRGGRRWSALLALALAAPGCVLHTRHAELSLLRMQDGTQGWSWNPLSDLVELIGLPFLVLISPLLALAGEADRELGLVALCMLVPGLICEKVAPEHRVGPDDGFLKPLEGSFPSVAVRLAREEGRASLVVSPQLVACQVVGIHPRTSLRELCETHGAALIERDGVTLAVPESTALHGYYDPTHEWRLVEDLARGVARPIVFGPDPPPVLSEGRYAVQARGRALVFGPGELELEEVVEGLAAAGPGLPADPEDREDTADPGPALAIEARDEPLQALVARLAAAAGREVDVRGGDLAQEVSILLAGAPAREALELLAWSCGRELRPTREGGLCLVAPAARLAGDLTGTPPQLLALLARAAGVDLIPPAPASWPEREVRLRLAGLPARDALWLLAGLLGCALEELPPRPPGPETLRAWRLRPPELAPPPPELVPPEVTAEVLRQLTRDAQTARVPELRQLLSGLLSTAVAGHEESLLEAPDPHLAGPAVGWLVSVEEEGPGSWADELRTLVIEGGDPLWEALLDRLRAWDPAWHPALRAAVVELAARARVEAELDRLGALAERPRELLEALPDQLAAVAALARLDAAAGADLRAGLERSSSQAWARCALEARSQGRLHAVLISQEQNGPAVCLIDGQVVEPGDRLPDRAGPRRSLAVLSLVLDHQVLVECGGERLELRLTR